jgi:hypothetical protein
MGVSGVRATAQSCYNLVIAILNPGVKVRGVGLTRLSEFQDQPRIRTAEQAIDRASQFVRTHGYYTSRPTSAQRQGDHWIVLLDVSFLGPSKIVSLTIDPQTGDITGFEAKKTA